MTSPQICRSCSARLYMLKHTETGKLNPIDADPVPDGNISIDLEQGTYRILTKDVLSVFKESGGEVRKSHFATCKFAKQHRR